MTPTLTPEAWAQIRYAYEHTDTAVEDICAAHRISSGTLRDRMRRWEWTRRREPIPRAGPPAVAAPRREIAGTFQTVQPPTPQHDSEAPNARPLASPHLRGDERGHEPPTESDAAGIVPRLQSAVARVLPAIEATITKLAAGPLRPREMEQTARALGTLTRTLRELNALLGQQQPGTRADDDPVPKDVDEFRFELARRIHAFIDARQAKQREAEAETDATAAESAEAESPTGKEGLEI